MNPDQKREGKGSSFPGRFAPEGKRPPSAAAPLGGGPGAGPAATPRWPESASHADLAALIPGYDPSKFPELDGETFAFEPGYEIALADPYPMTAQNYHDDLDEPDGERLERWRALELAIAERSPRVPPLVAVSDGGGLPDWLPDGNHRACLALGQGVGRLPAYVCRPR